LPISVKHVALVQRKVERAYDALDDFKKAHCGRVVSITLSLSKFGNDLKQVVTEFIFDLLKVILPLTFIDIRIIRQKAAFLELTKPHPLQEDFRSHLEECIGQVGAKKGFFASLYKVETRDNPTERLEFNVRLDTVLELWLEILGQSGKFIALICEILFTLNSMVIIERSKQVVRMVFRIVIHAKGLIAVAEDSCG
jgi:hypothetical protein